MKMPKQKFSVAFLDALIMLIGTFIAAMALDIFLIPYKIASGGASSVGLIVNYLTSGMIPVGVTIILVNIPLFFLGYKNMGLSYLLKSILGTLLYSLFIDFLMPLAEYFSEKTFGIDPGKGPDMLLYSIIGGLLLGIGLGLIIRSGSSTGGSDIAAQLLHKAFPQLTTGSHLVLVDAVIVLAAGLVFGNMIYSLYATVSLVVSSKVIDIVIEGVNHAKAVYIISEKSDDIAERILIDLDRGVTILLGKGAYTNKEKNVLLCVIASRQIVMLKRLIKEIDEKAFVILADAREVLGEGFGENKEVASASKKQLAK